MRRRWAGRVEDERASPGSSVYVQARAFLGKEFPVSMAGLNSRKVDGITLYTECSRVESDRTFSWFFCTKCKNAGQGLDPGLVAVSTLVETHSRPFCHDSIWT